MPTSDIAAILAKARSKCWADGETDGNQQDPASSVGETVHVGREFTDFGDPASMSHRAGFGRDQEDPSARFVYGHLGWVDTPDPASVKLLSTNLTVSK